MAEPGLINSKYRILYEVGGGGMGKVYAVVHEALGTTYALKQLRAELENNPEIASRFRHEAQMMARLQHPNIVRVFDIDSAAGFGTYLVMEFIEGIDLGKLLRREGRLPDAEVLKIGRAVASALETAHAAGLVHRDIKPANILIEEKTKRAVVTDFGIAKQIESEENVTRTGSFIGTYRYCSPEQIRNERAVRIDGRADVYSLGVVLYEMCSGERFLEHMSEMQIAHHVGFGAGWKPELGYRQPPPAELASLIEQCLAREREDRPTAAEMVLRLEHCLLSVLEQESATRALPAADQEATRRVPPTAPRSARRRRLTGWAMAAGTAAALLAALWLAGRRSITAPAPSSPPARPPNRASLLASRPSLRRPGRCRCARGRDSPSRSTSKAAHPARTYPSNGGWTARWWPRTSRSGSTDPIATPPARRASCRWRWRVARGRASRIRGR
jgi:serine/threonine protein kinase